MCSAGNVNCCNNVTTIIIILSSLVTYPHIDIIYYRYILYYCVRHNRTDCTIGQQPALQCITYYILIDIRSLQSVSIDLLPNAGDASRDDKGRPPYQVLKYIMDNI